MRMRGQSAARKSLSVDDPYSPRGSPAAAPDRARSGTGLSEADERGDDSRFGSVSESRLASSYNSLPGSLESPRGLAAAATGLQGAAGVAGVAASTSSERSDLRAAATEFRPRGASNASGGAASPKLQGASPAFATAAATAAAAPQPAKAQKQHQEPWQQLE